MKPSPCALTAAACVALMVTLSACSEPEPPQPQRKKTYDVGAGADQPGAVAKVGSALSVRVAPSASEHGLVDVTVVQVHQARVRDLRGFTINNSVRRSHVYYVRARLTNRSKRPLPGVRPSLYGQVSETEVVPAVRFGSDFKPCPAGRTTRTFKPGANASTCYVFLAPDRGQLQAVQYRFDEPKWPALTWNIP